MTAPLDTSDTSRRTFVDEGSAFHGTFASSCPIVVSGSIQGNVTAPEVTIAPLGVIDGRIKADKLTSAGTLSGTVDAVHVLLSGNVRGDTVIRTEQLDANLHATRGRLELTFGPRTPALVPEAASDAGAAGEEAAAVAGAEAAGADAVGAEAAAVAGADAVGADADAAADADADTDTSESDADDTDEASAADSEQDAALAASGGADAPAKNKSAGRRERRARKKLSRG
jgi:hypothetical protein